MAKAAAPEKGSASREEIEATLKAKKGYPYPYSTKRSKSIWSTI
jgi:hypothetical protein